MTNIRVIQTCLRWSSLGLNAAALQFLDKVVQDLFDDVFSMRFGFKDLSKKRGASLLQSMAVGAGNTQPEIGLGGEKATPSRSPKGWGFTCYF